MRGTDLAVRFALSPAGAAIDRVSVRHVGHSPVCWIFARSAGVAYNRPLLLTTIGRRTGRERSAVLPFFDVGEGRVAIVGSRGGMPTDPHWARNLRARPEARVHVHRRAHRVRTRLVEGAEREPIWKLLVERSPVYEQYQQRAARHRQIPVFLLEREDGGPLSAG